MTLPLVFEDSPEYGTPQQVDDNIIRVLAQNPGPFTYTGSGTYLIGNQEGIAVIDPGPDDQDHIDAVISASPGPITHILITHTHRDHSGGAALLKEKTGAPLYAFGAHPSSPADAPMPLEEGADFAFTPDIPLTDGRLIEGPAFTIEAVHTPGHLANHLCYAHRESGTLFTGDHVMGWASTVVAPPDGDMADYMASLDKLLSREDQIYRPTHGAPIKDPMRFVDALKAHRFARDTAIYEAITNGLSSVIDITKAVYTDLDRRLLPAAALNVQAHLTWHATRGNVEQTEEGHWRPTG